MFALVNQYRQENGVASLAYSANCQAQSDQQAEYNAINQTTGHGYDQLSTSTDYNITASHLVQNWKNSPGHNKQLLMPDNTRGAISVYIDSSGKCYCILTIDYDW